MASSGNSLPMFWDSLLVPSSVVNYLLFNSPEEHSSHLLHGGSLQSHISVLVCM